MTRKNPRREFFVCSAIIFRLTPPHTTNRNDGVPLSFRALRSLETRELEKVRTVLHDQHVSLALRGIAAVNALAYAVNDGPAAIRRLVFQEQEIAETNVACVVALTVADFQLVEETRETSGVVRSFAECHGDVFRRSAAFAVRVKCGVALQLAVEHFEIPQSTGAG